ncbi:MAG: hypothetical protein WBB01_20585 [Phormidesmis sp.]
MLFDSDVLLDVLARRQPFAVQSTITDFEDAVTSEAAKVAGAEVIVTRNTPDFVDSLVPAVLPTEFLAMLSE